MYLHFKKDWKNTVAFILTIGNGSNIETKEEKGYVHFAEHMMFLQTKNISNKNLKNNFDYIFHDLEAQTNREEVKIFGYFDIADFDIAINTLSEMIFNWECPKNLFKTEKDDILIEANEYFTSDEYLEYKEFLKIISLSKIGPLANIKTLKNISYNDLLKIKKVWQRVIHEPKNMLIIGSSLDKKQLSMVEKIFEINNTKKFNHKPFFISEKKYNISSNMSAFYFKSNHFHLCSFLLRQIYDDRFYGDFNFTQIENITAFWHSSEEIDFDKVKRNFLDPVSKKEFDKAKAIFLKSFYHKIDVVDIIDSLHWFSGFGQKQYAPIFSPDPKENLRYFENLTFEEFAEFFGEINK